MNKSPPKSKLLRSVKLLGAAGRYAIGEMAQKYKTEQTSKVNAAIIKRATDLVSSLDQLKGFPLKLGQLLSLDTTGILPDEIRQIFEKLQNQATPVDEALMRKTLKSELGEKINELDIDWTPLASASLGQVYRATTKEGDNIVLKMQYPGIENSLDGDLLIIKKITPLIASMSGKKIKLDGVFEELSEMFNREVDYEREARMHKKFMDLTKDSKEWMVPKLFDRYCTKKVIAMEFVRGKTLSEWVQTNPSLEDREKIASMAVDLFCCELFNWNIVQTDPNFANFLILEDSKICLLDFGASMEFGAGFVEKYRSLLIALKSGDRNKVIDLSIDFDLIDKREDEKGRESYLRMVEVSVKPFLLDGKFKFRNDDYIEQTKNVSWDFIRDTKYSPPPRHLIFLHRKLGGIYSLLHRMDVELDLKTFWQKWIERS